MTGPSNKVTHREGDLLIGKRNQTAIATLVERTTGFAMLLALPDGYKPEQVALALTAKVQTLPQVLRRSLTWDQGPEMRDWKEVRVDASIDVFFCDPYAPWQRDELNDRPRKRLTFAKPIEESSDLLLQ